jgi:hypothetical protein
MKYIVGNATKYDIIKGYAKNKDTFFLEKFDPIMEKYENLPLKPKYIKKIIVIIYKRLFIIQSINDLI